MNQYLLYDGQYLGQTIQSYETEMISVKSTLHEKSESTFHVHSNSYLSILLSGLYSEVTSTSQKVIYPSNMLYRPAYYQHKNQFLSDQTKCLNIEFSNSWFDKLDIHPQQVKPHIKNIQNHPLLLHLLIDFLKYRKIDFFEELLHQLVVTEESAHIPLRTPWLSKLLRILDNETKETHSLRSLSERVFVHPNYMSRVFKEHIGVTIGQYQMDKKVESAIKKLFVDRDPIVQIAVDCGFFDESHFIKTFKAYHQITPHQFRMLLQ